MLTRANWLSHYPLKVEIESSSLSVSTIIQVKGGESMSDYAKLLLGYIFALFALFILLEFLIVPLIDNGFVYVQSSVREISTELVPDVTKIIREERK